MIEQCKSAKIYVTDDYGKFVILEGNRETKVSDIKKLTEKIQKRNLLKFHPILVNKKFEIIDGQHRLEVARVLKLPIYFMTVNEAEIQCVIDINTTGTKWTSQDYLESYCKQGNEDYIILRSFLAKYTAVTVTQALTLFSLSKANRSPDFRAGYFKATDLDFATTIMDKLMLFEKVDARLPSISKFQRALIHIEKQGVEYDLDRLVRQSYLHLTTLLALPAGMRDTMYSMNRVYGFNGNQIKTFTYLKPKESDFTSSVESPSINELPEQKHRGVYHWPSHEMKLANILKLNMTIKYEPLVKSLKLEGFETAKLAKACCSWIRNNYGTRKDFVETVLARA